MNKFFLTIAFCVTFALGGIGGSIVGCSAASRYQLVSREYSVLRIDQLTGKTWRIGPGGWIAFEERETRK